MNYKKHVALYNKNNRDYLTIFPFESKIIFKLDNIFKEEKVIFVLYENHWDSKLNLKIFSKGNVFISKRQPIKIL